MTEYEPKYGYYATETQRIANVMPQWMKIRRERDSDGQSFINPFGARLDELNTAIETEFRNSFLELVELNEPDQLRKVKLPPDLKFPSPDTVVNNLLNSSFEMITSQDRLPDYWRSEGTGQVAVSSGLLGQRGLELTVASGQTAAVYQEVQQPIRAGEYWGFYVWYTSQAAGLTAPATGFGLEVVGTKADGSTETQRVTFTPNTGGYAKRASIRGAFSADVVKWKFRVVITNDGSFPITTPVVIDVAMAAEGNQLVDWRPHIFDNYPYINWYNYISPILCEHGIRAQFVERMADFWLNAVPTRVGVAQLLSSGGVADPAPSTGADGFTVHSTTGVLTEVDFWKDEWQFRWQLGYDGANPRVRAYGTEAGDVIGPFDLAFRNYRNWFEDGAIWTPEAMTNTNGHLLAVIKKQDHLGNTKRYLAIIDPKFPQPTPSYLEVTAMVELTGISTSVSLTRCEIRYSDQQWLYVGDGANEWAIRLYYDYFIVDYNARIMYLRETYDKIVPQLAVSTRDESVNTRPDEV